MPTHRYVTPTPQRGSTLLVAVVILLLASLMALMAMNVGVFEQRSSGNDLRAKIVHQAAEAGLAQGFEYLFRANPALLDNTAIWKTCNGVTAFPCSAVSADVRNNMWYLDAGKGGYDDASGILPSALTQHMLKRTTVLPAMGGFEVAYGVAPVLCRVPIQTPPITEIQCSNSTDIASLSDRRVVTFVSVAQIDEDGSGRTTLTQTVARSSLLAQQGGVPAVVAMGSVDPSGGGSIVAMPDAAGPGLDLSIWTRGDVDMGSRFATCDRQTILATGGITLTDPNWRTKVVDVSCPASSTEGWDILDKDGNPLADKNRDVDQDEFPCDLFEYAFNVKAWDDVVSGSDNFCEKRLPTIPFEGPKAKKDIYPDEAFLYQNAAKIIGGDSELVRQSQRCDSPCNLAGVEGLIWCKSGCGGGNPPWPNASLGTPTKPVVLVVDDEFQNNKTTVYGLVFVRDTSLTMDAGDGGAATMQINGSSAAIFGSVFVQGEVSTGSGNSMIFGDKDIMLQLGKSPGLVRFDTLRGGWSDTYSY